jgi:hypothetical protein
VPLSQAGFLAPSNPPDKIKLEVEQPELKKNGTLNYLHANSEVDRIETEPSDETGYSDAEVEQMQVAEQLDGDKIASPASDEGDELESFVQMQQKIVRGDLEDLADADERIHTVEELDPEQPVATDAEGGDEAEEQDSLDSVEEMNDNPTSDESGSLADAELEKIQLAEQLDEDKTSASSSNEEGEPESFLQMEETRIREDPEDLAGAEVEKIQLAEELDPEKTTATDVEGAGEIGEQDVEGALAEKKDNPTPDESGSLADAELEKIRLAEQLDEDKTATSSSDEEGAPESFFQIGSEALPKEPVGRKVLADAELEFQSELKKSGTTNNLRTDSAAESENGPSDETGYSDVEVEKMQVAEQIDEDKVSSPHSDEGDEPESFFQMQQEMAPDDPEDLADADEKIHEAEELEPEQPVATDSGGGDGVGEQEAFDGLESDNSAGAIMESAIGKDPEHSGDAELEKIATADQLDTGSSSDARDEPGNLADSELEKIQVAEQLDEGKTASKNSDAADSENF